MGQEDYLLREIEKITLLLRLILSKLTGNKDNQAIVIEKQFEETNELLRAELNFDLEKFLNLNESDSAEYISHFKGNAPANLELLAEIISQLGFSEEHAADRVCLQKAVQIYEFCNTAANTYSIERESKISFLRKFL
jgi:hypothetical protein